MTGWIIQGPNRNDRNKTGDDETVHRNGTTGHGSRCPGEVRYR